MSFLIGPWNVRTVRVGDDATAGRERKRYGVRQDLRFGSMVSSERQKPAPRAQELPERVDFEAGESAEQDVPRQSGYLPYRRGTRAALMENLESSALALGVRIDSVFSPPGRVFPNKQSSDPALSAHRSLLFLSGEWQVDREQRACQGLAQGHTSHHSRFRMEVARGNSLAEAKAHAWE